jgi:hypothetical protein
VGGRAPGPRAVPGVRPGRPLPQGRGGRGSKEKGVLIRKGGAHPSSKEKGVLIRGSSGIFMGGLRAHPQPGNRQKGLHRLAVSPLNGMVSRGPRPGHSLAAGRVTSSLPDLAGGDSDTRENWSQSK